MKQQINLLRIIYAIKDNLFLATNKKAGGVEEQKPHDKEQHDRRMQHLAPGTRWPPIGAGRQLAG